MDEDIRCMQVAEALYGVLMPDGVIDFNHISDHLQERWLIVAECAIHSAIGHVPGLDQEKPKEGL